MKLVTVYTVTKENFTSSDEKLVGVFGTTEEAQQEIEVDKDVTGTRRWTYHTEEITVLVPDASVSEPRWWRCAITSD